jgi:hypothetical protein
MTDAETGGWRGRAFGLELHSSFRAPGIATDRRAGSDTATVLTLAEPSAGGEPETLLQQPLPTGSFSISRGESGYVAEHAYFGRFGVAANGRRVECAPRDLPDWLWQRFLVGQMLPLAALLRGHEPLHASAVVAAGRALLLLGRSGTGKSSVALEAVARGATFLTDDVTALEPVDGEVVAHAGPALTSLSRHDLERLPAALTSGWTILGEHDGELRVAIDSPTADAVPLGAAFVLTRPGTAGELAIAEPQLGPAQVLIGGTFNAYVRTPERMVRQLDVSARVAETVPLRQVTAPEGVDAAAVAEAILAST